MNNMVRGRRSISEIIQFIRCLFLKKFKYFSSLETGNCVSNSSFKWRKIQYSQFSRTRVIFARFQLSRILRGRQIREFQNLGKIIIIIAHRRKTDLTDLQYDSGPVFSYKLRYIVGFWLVEMAISTNQKPTIYRNLYENTAPVVYPGNTVVD